MRPTTCTSPLRALLGLALALLVAPATPALADDADALVPMPAAVAMASAPLTPPAAAPGDADDALGSLDAVASAAAVDPETLLKLARSGVASLGPLSIGTPDAGLLLNPVPMPSGSYWRLRHPLDAYGTAETIAFIVTAIEDVEARFPGSPALVIGDISRSDGGQLSRHRSHQAGRDADVGFYYARGGLADFAVARRARDLDLRRTWALVRAFLTDTDVDRIFVDKSLIAVLFAYARSTENEDRDWLDDVFGRKGGGQKGIIQHVKGHKDHMHVRFFNQKAQEYGRLAYPVLVEEGALPPPRLTHRAHRGETVASLAARFHTTPAAIREANRMRGSRLRTGHSYLIPVRVMPGELTPVVVPPRRLPPGRSASAERLPVAPQLSSGVIHAGAGGGW
ncbi:MAG TPA: penicillin-insensitive murein endopeptidase [Vicinamibacteria bacterium]|nr:penicillin-insensitive murein endopeptidase [Vicinamibacteria bacterium]